MRIAVIADIHGNLEAFREVLADVHGNGIDTVICLGDVIGYGPDPEECLRLLRQEEIPLLMGNHEYAINAPGYLRRLNPDARLSLKITRGLLSRQSLDFLGGLTKFLVSRGGRFVHACPPDSVTTYLYDPGPVRLKTIFAALPEDICFFGHTHCLTMFSGAAPTQIQHEPLPAGITALQAGKRYLINAGSVGQPRDHLDHRAKYVIWDRSAMTVEVRPVTYDIEAVATKIIRLGLPEFNASRLRPTDGK